MRVTTGQSTQNEPFQVSSVKLRDLQRSAVYFSPAEGVAPLRLFGFFRGQMLRDDIRFPPLDGDRRMVGAEGAGGIHDGSGCQSETLCKIQHALLQSSTTSVSTLYLLVCASFLLLCLHTLRTFWETIPTGCRCILATILPHREFPPASPNLLTS